MARNGEEQEREGPVCVAAATVGTRGQPSTSVPPVLIEEEAGRAWRNIPATKTVRLQGQSERLNHHYQ